MVPPTPTGDYTMAPQLSSELEQHLLEMGVIDYKPKQEKPTAKVQYDMSFKDPRDPVTGEVPF